MAAHEKRAPAAATAKGPGARRGPNEKVTENTISNPSGKVNPGSWREEEAARAYVHMVEKVTEAKASLFLGFPVIWRGSTYDRVEAIQYSRYEEFRRIRISVILRDHSGAVYHASMKDIEIQVSPGWKLELEPFGKLGTRPSAVLKEALLDETPVICDGEEYSKITSIYFRYAQGRGVYIEVDLEERISGCIVTVAVKSAARTDRDSSAEMCRLTTEDEEDDQ